MRRRTALRQWAEKNPKRALALWASVVAIAVLGSIGYASDEADSDAPTDREECEECEQAYSQVGDGTVDWRGVCGYEHP